MLLESRRCDFNGLVRAGYCTYDLLGQYLGTRVPLNEIRRFGVVLLTEVPCAVVRQSKGISKKLCSEPERCEGGDPAQPDN